MSDKLVVVEMIQGLDTRGGAEVFFSNLCKELQKNKDIELHIVLLHDEIDESFASFVKSNKNNVHFCHKKNGFDLSSYAKLRKIIRFINPDVINTHLSCLISYFFAFGFKKRKWKMVHTVHNIASKETDRLTTMLRKTYIHKGRLSFIGISPTISKSVRHMFKNCEIYTICNGIPLAKHTRKTSNQNTTLRFICPARFEPQKNHTMLIETFDKYLNYYPNTKLSCYGDGTLFNDAKQRVLALKRNEQIFINHSVSNIGKYYRNSDVFVLSSTYEGNPISILEALSFGLPIIAPRIGGVPDIVKDGVNGLLFEVNDQTGMLKCLLKISDDIVLLSKISNQNFKDSLKYSIENTALQYIKCFKNMIGK